MLYAGRQTRTKDLVTQDQLTSTAGPLLMQVQEQFPSGTAGGTATSGGYYQRPINTTVTNEISGANLASGVITLPAGTYYAEGFCTFYQTGGSKCFLYNKTDSSVVLIGSSHYTSSSGTQNGISIVSGTFSITAPKDFVVYYQVNATTSYGLGFRAGSQTVPSIEIYSDLKIWKRS